MDIDDNDLTFNPDYSDLEDEGFPAPLSQALYDQAEKFQQWSERHYLRLLAIAADVEWMESLEAGVSHPAGCIYASFVGGEPEWNLVEGCNLPHEKLED